MGNPGCAAQLCRFIDTTGIGFGQGSSVSIDCWSNDSGSWQRFAGPNALTVGADGSIRFQYICYYGYVGGNVKIAIDGVESNVLVNG